jgi:hypothetical protein
MAALSNAALADLVRRHFPQGQVVAYAIARAESGGRPEAVGDSGASIGIWQIYRPAHPQYSFATLMDPDGNAAAAAAISSGGTRFTPWCTYEPAACGGRGNARYRAYLGEATAALGVTPTPAPSANASRAALWALLAGAAVLVGVAALPDPSPNRPKG